MKKVFLLIACLGLAQIAIGQTNTFPANGNVGIGTDVPANKLHVNGILRVGDHSTYFYGGQDASGGFLEQNGIGGEANSFRIQTVKPSTSAYSVFKSSPFTGFSFTSNGGGNTNLGVGVSTPLMPLHIYGGQPMTAGWNKTALLEATYPVAIFKSNNSKFAGIGYDHSSAMVFWVNSSDEDLSGNGNPVMVLRNNGNILIGRSSQVNNAYKLDILGKVRADEIVVNSTGADFVFEEDYQLQSLPSLEKYILAHKHLPEIPSAKTMQAEGVGVSELQTKLLQKIEELTLYLIEKDKELAKQRELNESQSKRLQEIEASQVKLEILLSKLIKSK